jgi:hypothetical protein
MFEPIGYVPLGVDQRDAIRAGAVGPGHGRVAAMLRREIRMIDRDLALTDVQTVDDFLAFERWEQRFAGTMFSVFAGVAVLLASVGLYGVTRHSAAQRTREIGIRIALGAQARHIWGLVTPRGCPACDRPWARGRRRPRRRAGPALAAGGDVAARPGHVPGRRCPADRGGIRRVVRACAPRDACGPHRGAARRMR